MSMGSSTRRAFAAGFVLLLTGALTPPSAQAARKRGKKAASPDALPRLPAKAKFYRGSEETVNERERRLYRECQGRPNAGACAGYAR